MRAILIRASIAVASCLFVATSVTAAPGSFESGVQAYKARQYSVAMNHFNAAAATSPNDVTLHYYMGLCYQGMNQIALAKQQYEWVAASGGNSVIANNARTALQQLSAYRGGAQPTGRSTAGTVGGEQPTLLASAGPKASGRLKVIEFYTDW